MKTGKYTYLEIEQYILKQPVSQRTKQMKNLEISWEIKAKQYIKTCGIWQLQYQKGSL